VHFVTLYSDMQSIDNWPSMPYWCISRTQSTTTGSDVKQSKQTE